MTQKAERRGSCCGVIPVLGLLLLLPLLPLAAAWAQEAQAPSSSPTSQAAPRPSAEHIRKAGEKDVERYTLPPETYEKATAYAGSRYRLYFIGFLYRVVILLLVLRLQMAPILRDLAERISRRRFLQGLIYIPLFLLTLAVLDLPTTVTRHWLALVYNLSVQDWPSWFWDWSKAIGLALLLGWTVVSILYAVIHHSPRRWWLYSWLASLPVIVLVLFISPVVIDPLFYEFTPLEQTRPALVERIEKVVERGGLEIPRERMFEMKASEKLNALNAYVTGIGASKRVVVWDTTSQRLSIPQTLFVFGHEMGHYVLGHVGKTIAFVAALLLLFLYLICRALPWALGHGGERLAIRDVDDFASLPLIVLCFSLLGFLSTPILSTYSRWQEHQADVYALEVIHGVVPNSQRAAAQAFQALGETNLSDPDPHPFIRFWLYSHPPLGERLVFARTYDPWSKGEAPQFIREP